MLRRAVRQVVYSIPPHYLPARLYALPNFIIVGAQKGGTTSLYKYLVQHPDVRSATKKEVHYFDTNYDKPLGWYRRHFPFRMALQATNALTGESSPYYLYHPDCARRIANILPDVKLVFCLRDPVDRAVSHYWHNVGRGREDLPMGEAFAAEQQRLGVERERLAEDTDYCSFAYQHFSYLSRGLYATQIRAYFDHFDRSQLLFLRSEDLFESPQSALDEVFRFIGLNSFTSPDLNPRNVGRHKSRADENVLAELTHFFQKPNEELSEMLDIEFDWRKPLAD